MNSEEGHPPPQHLGNVGAGDQARFGIATHWLAANFAGCWYRDACREADDLSNDARRREIIFAVACAESYLAEWVRDRVGPERFDIHLPPDDRRGIRERWKEVAKSLQEELVAAAAPKFNTSKPWRDFHKVVGFRDGLLHGRASRPYVPGTGVAVANLPKVEELAQLNPGFARDAVKDVIDELSAAAGTQAPDWLIEKSAE